MEKEILEEINSLRSRESVKELLKLKISWNVLIPGITNEIAREELMLQAAVSGGIDEISAMLSYKWPLKKNVVEQAIQRQDYGLLELCVYAGWKFQAEDCAFLNGIFDAASGPNPTLFHKGTEEAKQQRVFRIFAKKLVQFGAYAPGTEDRVIQYLLKIDKEWLHDYEKGGYLNLVLSHPISSDQKRGETLREVIKFEEYDWAVKLIQNGWPLNALTIDDKNQIKESCHKGIQKAVNPGFLGKILKKLM